MGREREKGRRLLTACREVSCVQFLLAASAGSGEMDWSLICLPLRHRRCLRCLALNVGDSRLSVVSVRSGRVGARDSF